MTVHDDLTLIRRELAITGTDEAWEALKRLEKAVEELSNAARNAIGALIAEPEPVYEYGVKYSLSLEAHGEGKFGYYWAPSYSHAREDAQDSGSTVVRRTKAGPWEEVK